MLYRNAFMSLIELHINILAELSQWQEGRADATDLVGDVIYKDNGAHRIRATCDTSPRMCIIEQFSLDGVLIYSYSDAADRVQEIAGRKEMHFSITTHGGLLNNDDQTQVALRDLAENIREFLVNGKTLTSSTYRPHAKIPS